MKFGVHLPTYWSDYGRTNLSTALVDTAQAAQNLGFASLWANDTVIVTNENAWASHIIDPLMALSSLIHVTPKMQIGTSILVLAQRNAILVAKQAATLDNLSQGRFILGIGTGWRESEFRFLNVDFERRGAITDEAISVMQTLWQEKPASFKGAFYNFDDALFYPKPVMGKIPLWIGGNSPRAIRRAATLGDGWLPLGISPTVLKRGAQKLRELSPEKSPTIAAHLLVRVAEVCQTPNENQSEVQIMGSAEEMIATLQEYEEAGLEHLICDFETNNIDDLLKQMQVFSTQVTPYFTNS